MSKKAPTTRKPISDLDILAMYEAVLPLLFAKDPDISASRQLNKCVLAHVQYDFLHYFMEDPVEATQNNRIDIQYVKWGGSFKSDTPPIALKRKELLNGTFEEKLRRNYDKAIERYRESHPEHTAFHCHRIKSITSPRIAVEFFRPKYKGKSNAFTTMDKRTFKTLESHILTLCRIALSFNIFFKRDYRYYDAFATICTQIANEHGLSEAETNLIPDILFGHSVKGIATKHFVSAATVKTHINHILKKTGTKNRMDFITKFFTSPENVQL